MSAFHGTARYNLDPKNRIVLPPRFREALRAEKGGHFMLTYGPGRYLLLFLPSQWEALLRDNMSAFRAASKEDEQAFKRFFFGNAVEAEPDSAGRILLPAEAREYSGIKGEAVIVGVGNKAELWDAAAWDAYANKHIAPNAERFARIFDL